MAARKKGKKVMTKAQKAILRSRSGAAVTQAELNRFRKKALDMKSTKSRSSAAKAIGGVTGGVAGVKAGASIGKLHKGKVGKMIGAAAATFGGGLAGAKRGKAAAKKRNKALNRRK